MANTALYTLKACPPPIAPVPSSALLYYLRSQARWRPEVMLRARSSHRASWVAEWNTVKLCQKKDTKGRGGLEQKSRGGIFQAEYGAVARRSLGNCRDTSFGLGGSIATRPWVSRACRTLTAANAVRYYGTRDARPWLARLTKLARAERTKDQGRLNELHPDDLPGPPLALSDPTGAIFGWSKGAAEPTLRCTEFDENGKVMRVSEKYKKMELIAKYGLLPRDLRKIDSSLLPSILVRPSSILVNLLHLRVLIQHNRVLIFDTWGSSNTYAQSMFMYDLEGKLGSKEAPRGAMPLPYEFRALEAVLVSVTSGLESEYEGIREPVSRVLRELEEDIDRDKLRHLLIYSKKLGTFEQKARLVRDAIDALLDEDEDLSAMYLTEKAQGTQRKIVDHTEIEMLLESYHKVADEIVQNSSNLVTNIRNTEEIIRAILDANRNALMLLDLKFSIGTLGIGSGAFVASLYGMNLKNYLEEAEFGFWGITSLSATFAIMVCVYGMSKLRRVQRLRMWAERGAGRRGSWRELAPTESLPGESRAERMKRLREERTAAWKWRKEWAEATMKEHDQYSRDGSKESHR